MFEAKPEKVAAVETMATMVPFCLLSKMVYGSGLS